MPPNKLECLGVDSAQFVADILDGMVVTQHYLDSDNEIEVVPSLMVGGAVIL